MHAGSSEQMNYYEILEVSPKASQGVIKAAYKSLMQRYHPDRNPGNAEAAEHSALVVQAYEVLSDTGRRVAYDSELKSQLDNLNTIQNRVRNTIASASLDEKEYEGHWLLWLLIAALILILWFVFSPSSKNQSVGAESKSTSSLLGILQPNSQPNSANIYATPISTRTIPAYLKDLNVDLDIPARPSVKSGFVLSIQTIGVVAGTFDSGKFMSFMEDNKEYIGQKLAEKLASARYDMLIKQNGDQYLKRVILDAIGEITNTSRLEALPSSGNEPHSHYGAVDILLPDSFMVSSPQPGPVTQP
jgi:curved DNA-binding protein CbpA